MRPDGRWATGHARRDTQRHQLTQRPAAARLGRINLITVLIVLVVLVVLGWFLFTGPLNGLFGGSTNINVNVPTPASHPAPQPSPKP